MLPDESGGLIALWFRVFNATFNNISVILWWSVLLVEETRVPRENHRPVACHWSGFEPWGGIIRGGLLYILCEGKTYLLLAVWWQYCNYIWSFKFWNQVFLVTVSTNIISFKLPSDRLNKHSQSLGSLEHFCTMLIYNLKQ